MGKMGKGSFEVFTGANKKFHFRLKAANGETVLASQGYKSKPGCLTGIKSVKTNSKKAAAFVKKTSKNGKKFFLLKAANGEVIGTSQMYSSPSACGTGIKSVGTVAGVAPTKTV